MNELHYAGAVAMLRNMLNCGLIDESDYCALETKYAAKFLPLIRAEKPCRNDNLPITLTEQERK